MIPRKLTQWIWLLCVSIGLTRLSGCAAPPKHPDEPGRSGLSISVSFNRGAGQGDYCFIPLQIGNGERGLFFVDTGNPVTVLDTSFEKFLGKRLGTTTLAYVEFGKAEAGRYGAPALYLNNTKLITGDYVYTQDLRKILGPIFRGRPVMGLLGADCLRHYCVKFDFISKRLYFLDPNTPTNADWGRAFPLSSSWKDHRFSVRQGFGETQGMDLEIDTGCIILTSPWDRLHLSRLD